jgi:hypothetical protein
MRIFQYVSPDNKRKVRVTVCTPADERGGCTPAFSVTGEEWLARKPGKFRREPDCVGCIHDIALECFPQLADVVALHLSDVEGVPMHGVANAWYWAAGALGGMGERYHGGNQAYLRERPRDILAKHLRITEEQCNTLLFILIISRDPKATLEAVIGMMRPRWLVEAQLASEKYAT